MPSKKQRAKAAKSAQTSSVPDAPHPDAPPYLSDNEIDKHLANSKDIADHMKPHLARLMKQLVAHDQAFFYGNLNRNQQ